LASKTEAVSIAKKFKQVTAEGNSDMRILVVGAGAIGGRLTTYGLDVA